MQTHVAIRLEDPPHFVTLRQKNRFTLFLFEFEMGPDDLNLFRILQVGKETRVPTQVFANAPIGCVWKVLTRQMGGAFFFRKLRGRVWLRIEPYWTRFFCSRSLKTWQRTFPWYLQPHICIFDVWMSTWNFSNIPTQACKKKFSDGCLNFFSDKKWQTFYHIGRCSHGLVTHHQTEDDNLTKTISSNKKKNAKEHQMKNLEWMKTWWWWEKWF